MTHAGSPDVYISCLSEKRCLCDAGQGRRRELWCIIPRSVCVRPIRGYDMSWWAWRTRPRHPVPAAARFCSNSEVRQSVLYGGAPPDIPYHARLCGTDTFRRVERNIRTCGGSLRKRPFLSVPCGNLLTLGEARCRQRIIWSPGRLLGPFLWSCMAAIIWLWWTFPMLCDGEERSRLYVALHPPGRLYGDGALYAFTQLLALLTVAGATPLVLISSTWIAEDGTLNLIWMPLQGVWWFLCCRQGFSLLGRDYGEKEEEESFELRNKEDLTPSGRVKTLHLHSRQFFSCMKT